LEFSIETSKLGTERKKIETQGVALKCDDKVAVTFFTNEGQKGPN
jgi:hypothetical protein